MFTEPLEEMARAIKEDKRNRLRWQNMCSSKGTQSHWRPFLDISSRHMSNGATLPDAPSDSHSRQTSEQGSSELLTKEKRSRLYVLMVYMWRCYRRRQRVGQNCWPAGGELSAAWKYFPKDGRRLLLVRCTNTGTIEPGKLQACKCAFLCPENHTCYHSDICV